MSPLPMVAILSASSVFRTRTGRDLLLSLPGAIKGGESAFSNATTRAAPRPLWSKVGLKHTLPTTCMTGRPTSAVGTLFEWFPALDVDL